MENIKCIVCKNIIKDLNIIHKNVRDDDFGNCKVVSCLFCNHIQLYGFVENLKDHYEQDLQTFDKNGNIRNLNLETIISKEKIEIERRLLELNDNLNNKRILDVGGGYCTFAKTLVNKYKEIEITVLEPSGSRVNTGKKYNGINEKDKINIMNLYLDEDFSNEYENYFDYVFIWHVLEHVDDKNINNLLKNLLKVCKPNGKVIIEVPNGNDELFKIDKYKNINYMIHHISYFTKESLEILFKQVKIKNYLIKFVQRYGFKNYLNWIYNLRYDLKDDMYYPSDDKYEKIWIEGKIKNQNTDAIWIEIKK